MKKIIVLFIANMVAVNIAFSQGAAVNTTGMPADGSAMLDISSSDQGVLIPRISLSATANPAPVTNPANSLLVYNIATAGDATPGYYYWDGTKWVQFTTEITITEALRAIKTKIYTNIAGH